jgi:hypothetical protein
MLHQQRGTVAALGREQQMHVIGHQHVGMHRAAETAREFAQMGQVEAVVLFGEEAHRTIVAPLDDVPGDPGNR